MFGFALMLGAVSVSALWTTPVFAQNLLHVAEIAKIVHENPDTFGPVSATCDATTGGTGCKFSNFSDSGTGKIVEGGHGKFTWADTGTVLFAGVSLNGAHDANGNPTGFCAPFVATSHLVFEDGGTIDLDQQGITCCASSSCPDFFGPINIDRTSMFITGGTGRFAGITGGGSRTVNSIAGSGSFIDEQVWVLPEKLKD
jgi:hypothetical protein